jgi:hypothetical protein
MDLTELQGLPLPGCCNGCCSGKSKSQARKPPEKKTTDSRSAGGNQMVDANGS